MVGAALGREVEEAPPKPQQPARAAVLRRQLKDGRATFVPVGVGVTVNAAILIGDDGRMIAVSGPGPHSAGATAELDLVVGAVPCHVHVTLHDADDSPLGEAHVKCMFVADPRTNDVRFVLSMTDTRGRVTFTFTNDPTAPLRGSVKVARATTPLVPGADPRTVDPGTVADAFLDVALGTTEIDLGTLTLGAPHVLVSGIVVGRDGSPVPGAVVRLVVPKTSPSGKKRWADFGYVRATCDSAGRFSINGVHQGGEPLWVTAIGRGSWRHEPIPLQPGSEVRLVLELQPSLRGRLLLDPDFPTSRLSVAAWPQSRGAPGYYWAVGWKLGSIAKDGSFTIGDLEPGLHTLGIAAGLDSEVFYVKDLPVATDATHLEARLDPLDLRGRFQVLRLTVRDEAGCLLDANVYAYPEGDGRLSQLGSARRPLLLSGPTRSLVIAAPGHFARVITPEDADRDIILTRGLPLTLKHDGLMPLPAPDLSLHLRLEPTTEAPTSSDPRAARYAAHHSPHHAPLRSDGTVSLRVPAVGSYRLHLEARRDREGYVCIRDLTPPDPFAFHLHEPGEVVTVPLDGPTLRERITTWAAGLPER